MTATENSLISPETSAAIDRLLNLANGRRRTRTLTRTDIDRLIDRYLCVPHSYAVVDGGSVANSYKYAASTTVALLAHVDGEVYLGISDAPAHATSPGRAWKVLQPWNVGSYETILAKLRQWTGCNGVIKLS